MFKIIETKDPKLCKAYRCKTNRAKKSVLCAKHKHRRNKEVHLLSYTYHLRKSRARERGHEWIITLEEFKKFCDETGYLEKKGKRAGSASIDRKDPTKGYSYGNMQILSLADNSAKKHTDNCPF